MRMVQGQVQLLWIVVQGSSLNRGYQVLPVLNDTCDMSNPTDKGICCDTKATCGATPTCPTGYIPKTDHQIHIVLERLVLFFI